MKQIKRKKELEKMATNTPVTSPEKDREHDYYAMGSSKFEGRRWNAPE